MDALSMGLNPSLVYHRPFRTLTFILTIFDENFQFIWMYPFRSGLGYRKWTQKGILADAFVLSQNVSGQQVLKGRRCNSDGLQPIAQVWPLNYDARA